MKVWQKTLIRVVLFFSIFLLLLGLLSQFFQPVWLKWNNYHTINGFYEQPEDTVEVLFLGASTMVCGVTPMELYDEYGMCAYNLATEQQPMLATYYWAEEAYRLHGDSLKTIVLDPSQLFSAPLDSFYHKALDGMHLSKAKVQALYDYADGDIEKTLSYLFPLSNYHDRWSSLEDTDFEKHTYAHDNGTRGYEFLTELHIDRYDMDKALSTTPILNTGTPEVKTIEESALYLDKLVNFCKEKGIELVMVKTPAKTWNLTKHNHTVKIAEEYGLTFLDYNVNPLYDEIGYLHAFDSIEGVHMNYYGATKFTKAIGRYLAENTTFTDVRKDERYVFMKEQSDLYNNRVMQTVNLRTYTNVADYISYAATGDNTIIITVKEEAANGLTDQERAIFTKLGLTALADLDVNDSYIGIIENGKVLCDEKRDSTDDNKNSLAYRYTMADGQHLTAVSGGAKHGKVSSCIIDDVEYAVNTKGLNIVVYNNVSKLVVDTVAFNTNDSADRATLYGLDTSAVLTEENAASKYAPDSIEGKVLAYQSKVKENLKNSQN